MMPARASCLHAAARRALVGAAAFARAHAPRRGAQPAVALAAGAPAPSPAARALRVPASAAVDVLVLAAAPVAAVVDPAAVAVALAPPAPLRHGSVRAPAHHAARSDTAARESHAAVRAAD